jgi:hypothetical protein
LITADDKAIPMISGSPKHRALRKLAEPLEADSATKGKTKAARIEMAQMPAFVAINFFFSDDVIGMVLNFVEGGVRCQVS